MTRRKMFVFLAIAGSMALTAIQSQAAMSEIPCSSIEGFYHDTLTRWSDVDGFIKNSQRYGISSTPWELNQSDVNAFQVRLLQCNEQGQLARAFHQYMLGNAMANFGKLIADSAQQGKSIGDQASKRDEFLKRITSLEQDMQSGAKPYAVIYEEFKTIVDEIYTFRSKGENRDFSKNHSEELIARAKEGFVKAQEADESAKTANIEALLVTLEKDVADASQNINTLFERYGELRQRAYAELANLNGPYQAKAQELLHQVENLGATLIARLNKQIADGIKEEIQKIRTTMAGYTSLEHLNSIKADQQRVEAIQGKIRELTTNPETQYIRVDFQTDNSLGGLASDLSAVQGRICKDAARQQCRASLPDFPDDYQNVLVSLVGGEITILDVACAAQNRGYYKGFSAGGMFSSDIVLKLENGVIYFKEQLYDAETRQPVGSGYTGNTITVLIATRMESEGKKQDIKNSAMEMYELFQKLGGIPQVKECQQ